MPYKLTFDDGGQVLIHHGVKGMKANNLIDMGYAATSNKNKK